MCLFQNVVRGPVMSTVRTPYFSLYTLLGLYTMTWYIQTSQEEKERVSKLMVCTYVYSSGLLDREYHYGQEALFKLHLLHIYE
jgi:hypothetical protein